MAGREGTGGGDAEPAPSIHWARVAEVVEGVLDGVGATAILAAVGWPATGPDALPPSPLAPDGGARVPRAEVALALHVVLLADLCERVPSARAYVDDSVAAGRPVVLDHAAVRTVAWPCGDLPPGREQVTRLLEPLGFERHATYPLERIRMTGHAYAHLDHSEVVPQWFVSELHPDLLSPAAQQVVTEVLAGSTDPVDEATVARLTVLSDDHDLPLDDAVDLVEVLRRCFDRQHPLPTDRAYDLLRSESPEMAWIATEGTACNHCTDRVADVEAVARTERERGRPIKDTVEVSASGRVRQTAHRAATVVRPLATVEGDVVEREVPGSFFEVISRDRLPDGSLDLAFDAANATGIFAMTRAPDAPPPPPAPRRPAIRPDRGGRPGFCRGGRGYGGRVDAIGPYRLDALVGRGTAGSVWRATRQGTVSQVVAIKRARTSIRTEVVDRLRQEAAILADLDHPHIVRVLDVLPDRSDVAIVMSYARGGSLHDLLAERGRLTPGQTVAVLARVADALGSAHRRGVLHGDVKPANILFTTDGEPLLGDFGVAQHLTPGLAGLDGVTGLRAVEGTTGYVDPELVATGRPEPRNDVYGLAVVAYVCLTGRQPHEGDTARAVLAAADVGDHRPLTEEPGVPPALAGLVEAALSRDPQRRPATAEDVARGLRASVAPDEVVLPGTASVLVEPEPSIVGDVPEPEPEPDPEEGEEGEVGSDAIGGGGGGGDLLLDDAGWAGVHVPDDLRDLDRSPPPLPGASAPASRPPAPVGPRPPGDPPDPPAPGAAAAGPRRVIGRSDVPPAGGPGDGPRAAGSSASALDPLGGVDRLGGDPDVPPDRGTRAFGPRPPAPADDGGPGRPLVTGLVVVLLLVGAVAGGLWVRARLDEEQEPSEVAVDAQAEPAGAACPVLPEPEVPPGGQRMEADLLGDGCPIPVVWDGRVLQLRLDPADERPRRYAFESAEGGTGNLVFGDWDCDGAESPALHQPSTGRVSYFSYVPERTDAEVEAVRIEDTGVVDGRPEVVAGGGADGCDVVEVVPSA